MPGKTVKLDKAGHTISLQRGTPGQKVGIAGPAKTEQIPLNNEPSFDGSKVGDQVSVKVEELSGVRQVTHFAKREPEEKQDPEKAAAIGGLFFGEFHGPCPSIISSNPSGILPASPEQTEDA